ncbi:MAG: hypothetical protein P8P74_10315 [Crocinitomicaceae bacterium]|nr:hypothetical protein [Crocinitomicaceae bacterium]
MPETILLVFCFLLIGNLFSKGITDLESFTHLAMSLMGILGYIGLILLLLEDRIKKWFIIFCLTLGIASFIIFISISGKEAWKWVLTMEEIDEWFIFVWPSIVSIISIVRITFQSLNKKN